MKATKIVLLAMFVGVLATQAVEIGNTEAEVIAAIGRPDGIIETERFTWFHYRRGVVRFEDGKVIEADLMTPEQLAEREAQDRADWARNQQIWQERERRRQAQEAAQARAAQAAREREAARREREFDQRIRELEAQVRLAEAREREAAQRAFRQPVIHHVGAPVVYHAPVTWSRPAQRGVSLGLSHNDQVVFSASNLDRVFGPMPMHTGYGQSSHGRSGLSGSVRVNF